MISTFHLFEARHTNHRVLRDNCRQLLHGQPVVAGGCIGKTM